MSTKFQALAALDCGELMDIQFIYDAVRVMMSCRIYTFSKLHTAGIKHYIEPASPKESEVGVYACIRNLFPFLLVVEHKVKALNCNVDRYIDR